MSRLAASAVVGLVLAVSASEVTARAIVPMPPKGIAVIAHRGGALVGPENTLAVFRKAIALGCDYVEIDVRQTRDGRFVVIHDSTVDRTTNGSGEVARMSFAELRRLDAGCKFAPEYKGQKVPSLEETLNLCRGKANIYLDHKDGPIAEIVEILRRREVIGEVVVYDGLEDLREWKRLAPEIPVMCSPHDRPRVPGTLPEAWKAIPVEVLDGHLVEWTEGMVRQAHDEGALVFVDVLGPVDNTPGWARALKLGVDGIQTDRPDGLLRLLRRLRLR